MNIYVGVDPGKEPSVCAIDKDFNILLNRILKDNDSFPYVFYKNIWEEIIESFGKSLIVTIEYPHSIFGASSRSNFVFGMSVGSCVQGAYSATPNVELIQPKLWQKKLWIEEDKLIKDSKTDTKATSLNCAKRILGDKWDEEYFLPTTRSKIVNHNLVDSFLIACYGIN